MSTHRPRSSRSALLEARAHEMRKALTPTEQLLWQALRGRRLGVMIRRQAVVERFIVDFLVPEPKLIIEVDGVYHAGRKGADTRRDRALERAGYRVLRVEASLVVRELARVLDIVRQAIEEAGTW
jgi:ATP-dependent DNA helicase RecQ